MGAPRKPTNILELSGSFKKNPNRARPDEPEPEPGIGDPPKHMIKGMKDVWEEISGLCAPGVLSQQDRPAFEILVKGMYECRKGETVWDVRLKKKVKRPVNAAYRDRVFKQLGRFGLTPSDRSTVAVPKKKKSERRFGSLG